MSFSYGQNLELWILYYWFLVYLSIFKVILSHLAFSNCAFQAHRHLATSSPMRQTRCVVQANIKSQRSNDDLTLQSDDFPCRISGGSVSRVAAMQDGLDFFTVRTLMMAVNWVSGEAEHRRFEEFEKAQPGIARLPIFNKKWFYEVQTWSLSLKLFQGVHDRWKKRWKYR